MKIILRKPLQKPVSSAVSARQFVPDLDEVMQDVITYIHNHVDDINNVDFLPHIYKIFTEVTGVITLDYRYEIKNLDSTKTQSISIF